MPTARALHLREVGRALAFSLARREGVSVALTGSAARGDSTAGSDLDLWVLGSGPSRREHRTFRGEPVTLLRDPPRLALEFDTLCFWEVDDLVVLSDEAGHFARVQAAFSRQRRAIRSSVLEATRDELSFELRHAAHGSAWQRVVFARAAGWRLACLWLYQRTGWRVPRLRTFRAHLPPAAQRHLASLLGLPARPPFVRRLARAATALHRRAAAWLRRAARQGARVAPRLEPLPREVHARLASGEVDEALLLLRRWQRESLWPALLDARSAGDLATFAALDVPRGARALLLEADGLTGVAPGEARRADEVVQRLRRLAHALGLDAELRRDGLAPTSPTPPPRATAPPRAPPRGPGSGRSPRRWRRPG